MLQCVRALAYLHGGQVTVNFLMYCEGSMPTVMSVIAD